MSDFSELLAVSVDNVIVPTYADLHTRAGDLHACIKLLEKSPTDAQLSNCRGLWIAARVPWEQSEGFLFGPVADQGLDPAMDSWPVDERQLESLMMSDVSLSADTITENLGGGMKGFHTIEYLLWGQDQSQTADKLSAAPRQLEYLVALTEAFHTDTNTLLQSWEGGAGELGYGKRFATSGSAGGVYSSQLDAVQELIGAMVGICDEVAFGKVAEPYKARDPDLIESQFSYNSLADFADNIRSIRNIYLGSRDGTVAPASLSTLVAEHDAKLDQQLKTQIDESVMALLAIGEGGKSFRDAIQDPQMDGAIESAQDSISKLMNTLNGGVLPLFVR